jgi:cation diffusion facilitator CzcD-associated flavoprotein CzcO
MIDSNLTTDVDVLVVGAGQAGLAAGIAVRQTGLRFLIMDAGDQPGGSWARYHDSLTLFSPARFSTLPRAAVPRTAQPLPDAGRHGALPQRLRHSLRAPRSHPSTRARHQLGRRSVRADIGRRRPSHGARGDRRLRRVRPTRNPRASRRHQLHRPLARRHALLVGHCDQRHPGALFRVPD